MKSQEFFNIISDIDERFVNEVRDDVRREDIFSETQRPQILRAERSASKAFLKPIMCGAACLAVAGGAALGFARFGGIGSVPANTGTSDAVLSGAASPGVSLVDNSDQTSSSVVGIVDNSNQTSDSETSIDKIIDSTEQSVDVQPQYVLQYIVDNKYKGMDGMRDYFNVHYTKNHGYGLGYLRSSGLAQKQIEYSDDCLELTLKIGTGSDIYAIDGGAVVFAGDSDFGNLIIIKHTRDDYSAYGYLDELFVKAGDIVENGTVIATSGSAQNYVDNSTRHCLDQISYDAVILRFDREITLEEWNLYAEVALAPTREYDGLSLKEYLDKEFAESPFGNYYNKYYNDSEISHGLASGCIGGMVNRPSGYKYSKNCDVLDIKLNNIGSDIYTMDGGSVVYAGASDFGNLVIIKHAEDDYSAYGYLGEVLVKVGDNVRDGDVIARSGSARNYSNKADYDVTVLRFDREITLSEWNDYSALVLKTPWHSSKPMQLS